MIALRSFIILGLSLLAALLATAAPPATAAAPAQDADIKTVAPPVQALRLAQGAGPRPLGLPSDAVQVPSLQCLSAQDAEITLNQARLRIGQVHRRPSSACPNGGIVAQSPPRGSTVRPGTTVEVIIAATGGSQQNAASVPDLEGLTPAEAQSLLRRDGLEIGRISRESAPAPLGTIVNQVPAAGSSASIGQRVNITVAAEVRVPDLRRLSREDAIERLAEASLGLGRVTEENSPQDNGTVIKQWPLPGVPAAASDKVDITIAKGALVPDLLTLSVDDASARLRAAGLQPGRIQRRTSDRPSGTVIQQLPAANVAARPGVTVNMVVAAAPVVPDLAGKTLDQARRLLSTQLLAVGNVTKRMASQTRGTVLEQQPAANSEASPRSRVDLVLADGLEAPRLVGLTLDEAGAELAKQLMRIGKIERQVAADGDGRIVEQTPAPGAAAAFGVAIDVVVRVSPKVPDLLGLKQDAVDTRLAEQQLSLSNVDYQLSPATPDGTVLRQDPPAGAEITDGQAVSIVMAVTGRPADRPDLVPVPTLTSLTVTQADQNLKLAGLILQTEDVTNNSRPHRITAQSPAPGLFVKAGTPVTALIEAVDEVIVPDLTGLDQAVVDTRLTDSFLELGERSWKLSTKRQGTVVEQDPPPGTEISFGNPVDIVLSANSLIPDLTGLTPDEATPILSGNELQLASVEEVFSFRWPGTIVAQIPPPDSPTGANSQVRVQVVGLMGPLTAGGSLMLMLAGAVWFKTRQGGHGGSAHQTPKPPPVYGIAKSAASRPAFNRTARAARPPASASSGSGPRYVVETDPGTQVIQTDAPNLVKPSIRLRGRADSGEQQLAI